MNAVLIRSIPEGHFDRKRAEKMLARAEKASGASIQWGQHMQCYGAYVWETDYLLPVLYLKGVATVELVDGDCWIEWLAGYDLHDWLTELEREIAADAKAEGAANLVGFMRKGWSRVLKPMGWKSEEVDGRMIFRKAL